MRFVDTNIFIRFLTEDIPDKADACEKLFKRAISGKSQLFTTDLVIAEIVWVLELYYELAKNDVREKVEKILNTPNLFCPQKDIILSALNVYTEKNIDFIDAFNAMTLRDKGIGELYSYDPHFDRIDGLVRLEP
ncbi:MAG: PIN domain-containing protein [Deltaproteobacteria bacterium]|nr:PIN domain-containing protein [Deltaproteobacteria bacterium]